MPNSFSAFAIPVAVVTPSDLIASMSGPQISRPGCSLGLPGLSSLLQPGDPFGGGLCDVACHLKANRLFRWDRTIEPTFLAVEIILKVVDAFECQLIEADRQDHPKGGTAINPGRRKITLSVAERHPRPLRRNKKLGRRLIVLQAGGDLPVENIEFGVGLFENIAIAVV
jgi:hypothetical protein